MTAPLILYHVPGRSRASTLEPTCVVDINAGPTLEQSPRACMHARMEISFSAGTCMWLFGEISFCNSHKRALDISFVSIVLFVSRYENSA